MRWNCWNTNPIESPRSRDRVGSSSSLTSCPAMRIVPDVGRSSTPRSPSMVDFPEPEGPTIDMKSPGKICSETSSQGVHLDLFSVDP